MISAVIILAPNEEPINGVLERVKQQCDELIVVRGGSRGWARNEGLRKARNRYILMVDNDQMLLPNYVKKLLEKMGDEAAVCCGLALPHSKLSLIARLEEYFKAIVSFNIRASGCGGNLYDKEAVLEVGGFRETDERLMDYDYELFKRLERIYGTVFVPEAILIHLKRYTLKYLVKAGLTCAMTRDVSLFRLLGRTFAAPLRVFKYWKTIYNLSSDESIFLLPFHGMFRQFIFFLCDVSRRVIK